MTTDELINSLPLAVRNAAYEDAAVGAETWNTCEHGRCDSLFGYFHYGKQPLQFSPALPFTDDPTFG
jgi:hypothetical protein